MFTFLGSRVSFLSLQSSIFVPHGCVVRNLFLPLCFREGFVLFDLGVIDPKVTPDHDVGTEVRLSFCFCACCFPGNVPGVGP